LKRKNKYSINNENLSENVDFYITIVTQTVRIFGDVWRRTEDSYLDSPVRVCDLYKKSFLVVVSTFGWNVKLAAKRVRAMNNDVIIKERLKRVGWVLHYDPK